MSRKTLSKIIKFVLAIIATYASLTVFFSDDATELNYWTIKQIHRGYQIAIDPVDLPLIVVLIFISYTLYSLSILAPKANLPKFSASILKLFSHDVTVGQWYVDNNDENQLCAHFGEYETGTCWKIGFHNPTKEEGIYGPYIELPTGKYRARYRIKILEFSPTTDKAFAKLDIIANVRPNNPLAIMYLRQSDFSKRNRYYVFGLDFHVSPSDSKIECRMLSVPGFKGTVDLVFDHVRLTRIDSVRSVPFNFASDKSQ